ncbi:hypothetical protein [Enterovirga aerilata]|uniref:Uncharacterized protein n=1 Tax=Enterovirga aerilata TaxID=2730920 RepID=A0A849IGD6_9HYPH|nr:hypothetical protein [Enterovirga sp. DB1703]NNM75017.1 hypothetical protein [Enterovirga sp. DB1703]
MIVSLTLRGATHRILISDDGVTFTDPSVSPPLTASERESVLAYVAAQRRAREPAERILARTRRDTRRVAAVALSAAGCVLVQDLARAADQAPLDPGTGAVLILIAILVASVFGMFWPWPVREERSESSDPYADAFGDVPSEPQRGRE